MAINFTVSFTFTPGTTISSSQVNTNFSDEAGVWQGLEAGTKSLSRLAVDGTTTTGTLSTSGFISVLVTKTTTYAITATDSNIMVNTTGGAVTVTLPTAVGVSGQRYTIKDWKGTANSNKITIATTSSQTIDAQTSFIISSIYGEVTLVSDGANWSVVGFGPSAVVLLGQAAASSSASISFTGLDGGRFSEFFVMIGNMAASGAGTFLTMQISTGSGFVITGYTDAQYRVLQSGAAGGGGTTSTTAWQVGIYTEALSSVSHYYARISVPMPSNTGANKAMNYQGSAISSNGANTVSFTGGGQGSFNSAAVDGIKFLMSSGNITSGDFYLYGVRNQ